MFAIKVSNRVLVFTSKYGGNGKNYTVGTVTELGKGYINFCKYVYIRPKIKKKMFVCHLLQPSSLAPTGKNCLEKELFFKSVFVILFFRAEKVKQTSTVK